MLMDCDKSALVLVDYQTRLMPAIEGGEAAIAEALFLAGVARTLDVPVIGTEQNPAGLGPNDDRIRAACDATLAKLHFDATADGLVEHLRAAGRTVDHVVIAGCEAHVCLMQTALGCQRAGLSVFVVPQACGSRREADKALALSRMAQAGVFAVNAEMVAFEWLRASDHPRFKAVLALIKARTA
jgi:nicotinamidase-related amidase